jgi:hypothetical protein
MQFSNPFFLSNLLEIGKPETAKINTIFLEPSCINETGLKEEKDLFM